MPCFLLFVFRFSFLSFLIFFLHPGMFIFFMSLRLCSSHLLLSASAYFIVRVLSACCHLYPTPSRNYFVFYSSRTFFVSLISRVAFFLLCSRTRYASTWSAYLESLAFGFSLSHCLWPQNLNLSRMKNQEGHWGYCWCRWVEGTVECEDNDNKNNKNMINTLPWVPSVVRLSLGRRLVNLLPVAQRTNVISRAGSCPADDAICEGISPLGCW